MWRRQAYMTLQKEGKIIAGRVLYKHRTANGVTRTKK